MMTSMSNFDVNKLIADYKKLSDEEKKEVFKKLYLSDFAISFARYKILENYGGQNIHDIDINDIVAYSFRPDKMTVTRSSDSFVASYIDGESLMARATGSISVPSGWLVALLYIKVGRWEHEGDEIAKVKLIVPHNQGHTMATSGVYPCLYVITYEKGL